MLLGNNKGNSFEVDLVDGKFNIENIDNDLLSKYDIVRRIVGELIDYLIQNNHLGKESRREDKLNNIEFIEYLKEYGYNLIFCNKNLISPRMYQNKENLDEYVDKNCIRLNYNGDEFMALNSTSTKISIQKIEVEILPDRLNIEKYHDKENDIYVLYDGIDIEFNKDEIKDYLSKKKRYVRVSITVSIECLKEKVGTIFVMNK